MRGKVLIWTSVAAASLGIACGQKPSAAQTASAGAVSGGGRQVEIIDPILKMRAYSFTIPAKWSFEGTMRQGTPCVAGPFPIFRIMSPDGITETKALPRFDWAWSTGSKPAPKQSSDCLELNKEMTGAEFLKYMVPILGVTFVSEQPAENLAAVQENTRKLNAQSAAQAPRGVPPVVQSADQARFLVRYNINSIPVEEYLRVTINCTDAPRRLGQDTNVTHFHSCSAYVSRTRARQGQLETSREEIAPISKSFAINQEWSQKWLAMALDKINAVSRQGSEMLAKMGADANRAMAAQHDSFVQGQDMRQRMHDQFLSTMQRGTDLSMKATQNSMNARARVADDWADYALDQQKRLDPNTGQITKDSSAYSYTWIDAFGQHYQTNNVNDNPNGRLKGDWTLQTNVR